LFDQIVLQDARRQEFEMEFPGVPVELVAVFAGDEWVFGSEAVLDGVARGALFAFGGARSG